MGDARVYLELGVGIVGVVISFLNLYLARRWTTADAAREAEKKDLADFKAKFFHVRDQLLFKGVIEPGD